MHERIIFSVMDIFQLNLTFLRTVCKIGNIWKYYSASNLLKESILNRKLFVFPDGRRNNHLFDDFHTIHAENV